MSTVDLPVDLQSLLPESSFLLTHFELYNWGPFAGLHRAQIDPKGTAIIGQTGSGKTTLVDAFMTLIARNPKYNLASTGGHESDRDLISYIRGVTGAGNETESTDHILRPGKTVTAIAAHFSNAKETVHIMGIFWIDGTSSAAADLKRLWLFARNSELTIKDCLELLQDGGMRALKQLGREFENLKVHDSKTAYLAQLRRYFEVSDNAFTLLNRAAGLKQLNSIDVLFRELVLDDRSVFKRAAEVASEFDDLASIRAELELARKQQQSLFPIEQEYAVFVKNTHVLKQNKALHAIAGCWYAGHAYRLWQAREQLAVDELTHCDALSLALSHKVEEAQLQAEHSHVAYLKLGGTSIEQLRDTIRSQQTLLEQCRINARDYVQLTRRLDMATGIDAVSLAQNQSKAGQLKQGQEAALEERKQQTWDLGAVSRQHQNSVDELREEIAKVENSPGSNIPSKYQLFREKLSQALQLDETSLPYVAELVEVKMEQAHWRGAIERAIGGHRLRLLVPQQVMKQALQWVNDRENRLHVRLLQANQDVKPALFFEDGFTRKLNFKQHACREALKHFLAGIDRHCVNDASELKHTEHAITQQGLMSGKSGLFEKKDQMRLDQDWMTGFDNKDRLRSLGQQLSVTKKELSKAEQQFEAAKKDCEDKEQLIGLLESLVKLQFSDIDLQSAEKQLAVLEEQLQGLLDPGSDTEKARLQWEEAKRYLKQCQIELNDNEVEKGQWQHRRGDARLNKDDAFSRIGAGLDEQEQTLGDGVFTAPEDESIHDLRRLEENEKEKLQSKINKIAQALNNNENRLIRFMSHAKSIDSGALAEVGTEINDVENFLQQLDVLNKEALPKKQKRFLDYLNQSSDQGVTQLLSNISNEVNMIEERIEELNATMRRVDFRPGSYLRLEPRRVSHESLKTLQKAQRYLRSAALKDDAGESHYRALFDVVALLREAAERKNTVGAKALLDPRYRLQFSVSVINKSTGEVIETRTGSQGGSGGEKEIIASYILTASLSYALCPDGVSQPLFSTIVLDEAFSKSSRAVAARIITALREFGLHPLFITPNKEIRLLRDHTRSAVLIHRRGQTASMTSLSWEELEQQAMTQIDKMTKELI